MSMPERWNLHSNWKYVFPPLQKSPKISMINLTRMPFSDHLHVHLSSDLHGNKLPEFLESVITDTQKAETTKCSWFNSRKILFWINRCNSNGWELIAKCCFIRTSFSINNYFCVFSLPICQNNAICTVNFYTAPYYQCTCPSGIYGNGNNYWSQLERAVLWRLCRGLRSKLSIHNDDYNNYYDHNHHDQNDDSKSMRW